MDEMEYEEDFADDEEPMNQDGMADEEAKELEASVSLPIHGSDRLNSMIGTTQKRI